jgi:hypothetical protein
VPRAWDQRGYLYYIWKKKYSGLGLNELRELRQLREENGKLKRLVADLSLDRQRVRMRELAEQGSIEGIQ